MKGSHANRLLNSLICCTVIIIGGCVTVPDAHYIDALKPGPGGPCFATGIKVCEVDSNSAIVWARLTKNPKPAERNAPFPIIRYQDPKTKEFSKSFNRRKSTVWKPVVQFKAGTNIETVAGAAPGATGQVRVLYRNKGGKWKGTSWREVDPEKDFTAQFPLKCLRPDSRYDVVVQGRTSADADDGSLIKGGFRTAPSADQASRVVFTVSTGQAYNHRDSDEGYKIYPSILKIDPSFFVHTGDIVYYDGLGKNADLARYHWARTYSLPTNVDFHRQVSSYFIKDDHDTFMDDCWPTMETTYMGDLTFEQGQAIFREQVGMGEKTHRTIRWGKDLQIWLMEGRDFRSPNPMPDGPEKTIWGKKQKAWFKRTVETSDAAFRILISPTPIVGPDRDNKRDNHSNKNFQHEGDEIRDFIAQQDNMIVVCGDRHWQYVSEDRRTGVREYSCGPASDKHAAGWKPKDRRPEHKFLAVRGGFLSVTVERENDIPTMILRHHSVDGVIRNEETYVANEELQ
ncbi:alkaline phosphatase D family protein [Candidatus Hydrogenedentota bacterium]